MKRRPLFVAAGTTVPARTLAVDGNVAGADATYSHWRAAPATPRELIADTSTAMLVAAARDPARWLDGYDTVAIDHIDADGLLSVAVACRPELTRAAEAAALLVAAAECGDFGAWHGDQPYRLMLRLHGVIREAQDVGDGWKQRSLDRVVDDFERLLDEARSPDAGRDAQVAWVVGVRERLQRSDGFELMLDGDLARISWTRRHGHVDDFLVVRRDDDLPPHAIDGLVPATAFQLLSQRVDDGWIHQIDAPRHSWARTVQRPMVAWPDLTAMAWRLTQDDGVRWATLPTSAKVGFTCILASVDEGGSPAASRLDPAAIAAAWPQR
ncbi:MAG: hypothetical protein H0X45_03740 [Planctomycetes bacterium]|nr:hypothetical protein [Planctomycetota bacterium]